MIPTPAAAMQLDKRYASPTFRLGVDLTDPTALTVHRLEQHLLEDLAPVTRDRAQILLVSLDKLSVSPLVDRTPARVLGRSKEQPALVQFAKDLAVWVKRTFRDVTADDRSLLLGLLASRDVSVGPKGRDSLGRSTHVLQTPYGRFILD